MHRQRPGARGRERSECAGALGAGRVGEGRGAALDERRPITAERKTAAQMAPERPRQNPGAATAAGKQPGAAGGTAAGVLLYLGPQVGMIAQKIGAGQGHPPQLPGLVGAQAGGHETGQIGGWRGHLEESSEVGETKRQAVFLAVPDTFVASAHGPGRGAPDQALARVEERIAQGGQQGRVKGFDRGIGVASREIDLAGVAVAHDFAPGETGVTRVQRLEQAFGGVRRQQIVGIDEFDEGLGGPGDTLVGGVGRTVVVLDDDDGVFPAGGGVANQGQGIVARAVVDEDVGFGKVAALVPDRRQDPGQVGRLVENRHDEGHAGKRPRGRCLGRCLGRCRGRWAAHGWPPPPRNRRRASRGDAPLIRSMTRFRSRIARDRLPARRWAPRGRSVGRPVSPESDGTGRYIFVWTLLMTSFANRSLKPEINASAAKK